MIIDHSTPILTGADLITFPDWSYPAGATGNSTQVVEVCQVEGQNDTSTAVGGSVDGCACNP